MGDVLTPHINQARRTKHGAKHPVNKRIPMFFFCKYNRNSNSKTLKVKTSACESIITVMMIMIRVIKTMITAIIIISDDNNNNKRIGNINGSVHDGAWYCCHGGACECVGVLLLHSMARQCIGRLGLLSESSRVWVWVGVGGRRRQR